MSTGGKARSAHHSLREEENEPFFESHQTPSRSSRGSPSGCHRPLGRQCQPEGARKPISDTYLYRDTVSYPTVHQEAITITRRLTRQQSRELTREQLLQAAAELFAEHGVNGTSVEQIVERAGYTRGAFYGNFEGKHEIVLALLEQRTQRELEEMQELSREAGSFDNLMECLRSWHRQRDATLGSWLALRTELWLYGLRDPELLPMLADRERRSRAALAQSLEQGFAARSVAPPAPAEFLALIMHSLGDGLSIQRVLSPEDTDTDTVVDAIELLMRSWSALSRSTAPADGASHPSPGRPTAKGRAPSIEKPEKNP